MTILIADDDPVLVHVLTTRLKKLGYRVVVAFDAMQAIMIALRTPPNAIILDISMPGGTGLQVLRQLKNSTKTNRIPIIVVTGSVEPGMAETVKKLGADEFLTKPPNFDQLDSILSRRLAACS